jgi:hypothetical protein
MRGVHDWRDDPPPASPGLAVAYEQAVAEQRGEAMPHLRAFPFEAVVVFDKRAGDRIGAIAHQQLSRQQPAGEYFPLEAPFFPNFQ